MNRLLVIGLGIGLKSNDGIRRFQSFCRSHELDHIVLGQGEVWQGGEMEKGPGGGQKINTLRSFLERETSNRLVMVCDTFDLFPIGNETMITTAYYHLVPNADYVLFAAEKYCWPDESLVPAYQSRSASSTPYLYLNSGSFLGTRDRVLDLIRTEIDDSDDDQLYFSRRYLEGGSIVLDHRCELFQTLNGNSEEEVTLEGDRVHNTLTDTYPVIIHGNGPSKIRLNRIENYVCPPRSVQVLSAGAEYPTILIAAHVDNQRSGYQEFMESLDGLRIAYPCSVIFVYDQSPISTLSLPYSNDAGINYSFGTAKYQYSDFQSTDAEYYFLLEQHVILIDPHWLLSAVGFLSSPGGYASAVAPMIRRGTDYLTNFWGDIRKNGKYRRSPDYCQIMRRDIRGLFNIPYASGALLIRRESVLDLASVSKPSADPDMELCESLRKRFQFIYLDNRGIYGRYVGERF